MMKLTTVALALAAAATLAACNDRKADRSEAGAPAPTASSPADSAPAADAGSAASPAGPRDVQRDLTSLNTEDQVRRSTGAYYDTLDLTVDPGSGRVNVRMNAVGFLPRVEVLDASQRTLVEAEGVTLNASNLSTAEINEQLEPGRYILVFTSVQPNTTGAYSVDLAEERQTPLM